MGENHPFPCNDSAIQAQFLGYLRSDNFNYRILEKLIEMSTIKFFCPVNKKLPGTGCCGEKTNKSSMAFFKKLSKMLSVSIDINVFIIIGSLYSLESCVHEVDSILGHPV